MINAILVDDEKNALEMMEWLLRTYCPEVAIAGMFTSAEEALPVIRKTNPDVVFLDIEMPRMNGFDLLEQLEKPSFHIVFCTAYDQFAIRAFKYSALNYLLKPIDPEDLKTTIGRVRSREQLPNREQFELLMQGILGQPKQTPARIALNSGDGVVFVSTGDIIYCEAESNYTQVVLVGNKKIMVSKVLRELDEALSGPDFFRVHSSFLVNINHIKKLVKGEGGYLVMDNDAIVSVSRSRRQEFMDHFPRF